MTERDDRAGIGDMSSLSRMMCPARYELGVDLERALDQLGGALTVAGIPLWRAPESVDDLVDLEAAITPMRLPEDVRRFWMRVDARTLRVQPYPMMTSPEAALLFWRQARDEFRDMQPLALVDVGYESHFCMSVELDVGHIRGGALFEWCVSDPSGFTRRFNGIADWLAYIAELVSRGLYQRLDAKHGAVWVVPGYENAHAEQALRSTPDPHPVHGPALHVGGDILDWPKHWQRANGLRDEHLRLRGATHTIAQVLASPPAVQLRATIAARVIDYAGGGSWARVRVDDGTGTLNVYCPPGTTLVGPRNGEWNEFDIVVAPGLRHIPADPHTAGSGIEDDVERVTAVLMARYGGPAGATAEAVRPMSASSA
jgi:hypothetical protein